MVQVIGGAGILHLRRFQPLRHGRGMHRVPIPVEILMRQIMAVMLLHFLEPVAHQRIGAQKGGVGGQQLFSEIQRAIDTADDAAAFTAQHFGMFGH